MHEVERDCTMHMIHDVTCRVAWAIMVVLAGRARGGAPRAD
jgi:hypothetical protein